LVLTYLINYLIKLKEINVYKILTNRLGNVFTHQQYLFALGRNLRTL